MFDNVDTTANEPLAERLRPRTLEEFAGQKPVSYTHLTLPTIA